MKTIFLFIISALITITTWAQTPGVPALRKPQAQPVKVQDQVNYSLPTLQDTVKMLMDKVMALEKERLPGGKKSIRTIVPGAANMCFPYSDPRYPSQSFFQGVVVDDAVCNDNPNAVLIVTVETRQPRQPLPVTVSYDAADGRWKISLQGYQSAGIAKNVQCYNFNGKDQTMCPSSGLYQNVALVDPVTLSPNVDNQIEFNLLITERAANPIPKIKRKE